MRYGIIAVLVFLVGCESMPRGEAYFQTLHTVDVLQTINGPADDPCYKEGNPVTRRLIGEHPSRGDVLAWGLAWGATHYSVSRYLDNNAPEWVLGAWQLISTGYVAITVHNNYQMGIRPWGDNDYSNADDPELCERLANR